jgi:hypothetical protein
MERNVDFLQEIFVFENLLFTQMRVPEEMEKRFIRESEFWIRQGWMDGEQNEK